MEEAQIKYKDTIESKEERKAFQNAWGNQNFGSLRKLLKRHVNILKEERGDPEMLLKLAEKEENMKRSKHSLPKTKQIRMYRKTSVEK